MILTSQIVVAFLLNAFWQIPFMIFLVKAGCKGLPGLAAKYQYQIWFGTLIFSLLIPLTIAARSAISTNSILVVSSRSQSSIHSVSQGVTSTGNRKQVQETIWEKLQRILNQQVLSSQKVVFSVFGGYLSFFLSQVLGFVRIWFRTQQVVTNCQPGLVSTRMECIIKRCHATFGHHNVQILCGEKKQGPLTAGVFHPVIVLPEQFFQEESEEVLVSVLGHEFAHIYRNDFLVNSIAELLMLPISFHPLARTIKNQLHRTRELACDDLVTATLVDKLTYARVLVQVARSIVVNSMPNHWLGIFEKNILEERIMTLVTDKIYSSNKKMAALVLGFIFALATSTALAFPVSIKKDKASLWIQFEQGSMTIAINPKEPEPRISLDVLKTMIELESTPLTINAKGIDCQTLSTYLSQVTGNEINWEAEDMDIDLKNAPFAETAGFLAKQGKLTINGIPFSDIQATKNRLESSSFSVSIQNASLVDVTRVLGRLTDRSLDLKSKIENNKKISVSIENVTLKELTQRIIQEASLQ